MSNGVPVSLRNAALALIAIASLLLAGCGGGGGGSSDTSGGAAPEAGGEMTIAQGSEVETMNPTTAVDASSINVLSQIMEPLYKADVDGKIEPWLVASAETSADERTWTFELRPGVKFSTGKPMTADDVVFSLDSARKSANWGTLFEAFKDVKATSPSTVVITTTQPVPAMEAILSSFATVIVPKNFGGASEDQFGQKPVGTGPFMLGNWAQGQALTLLANPNYWDETRPLLDKVTFRSVPDDNSRVSQLRGGDLDVIAAPPASQLQSLEQVPTVKVGEYALATSSYILLNEREAQFKDPRFREAVSLAVDRDSIVEAALSGHGEVGGAFLSPAVPMHDAEIEAPARDVAKAKQLLGEAVKDGVSPEFTLLLESGSSQGNLTTQIIQQNLEEAGFKVTLQQLDISTLIGQLSEGTYDAALLGLYPNVPDPSENTAFYIATEGLFTGADMTSLSKLAEAGARESDTEKRREIYAEIQQEVADQGNLVVLSYLPWIWATQDDVAGFAVNPLDISWLADVGFSG